MNRKPLLAIIAALGLGTATGSALAYDKSDIRAMEQAKITLEQAIEMDQRTQKNEDQWADRKSEIDMRRDHAEYEVEVMTTDKRIYDIRIDAVNGNVLENREDHDD